MGELKPRPFCGSKYAQMRKIADEMRKIADEIEREVAERTCSMEYNEYWSGGELYPTEAYKCSVCGHITQEGLPDYCPRCGAKVVEG